MKKSIFTKTKLTSFHLFLLLMVVVILGIGLGLGGSRIISTAPLHTQDREGFKEIKKYTFIHVPKTGGSAMHKVLEKHSQHFDLYSNHFHNLVATKYNRPVLCIREPTDRFISIYKYWKQHVPKFHPKIDTSVKHFIQMLKTDAGELLIGNPPFLSEYHYFPQSHFIEPSVYSHSIVVLYDKHNLQQKTGKLLKYLEITGSQTIQMPVERVSENAEVKLDEEDRKFIREKYREDYELWEILNRQPEKFKKVL
jgi:hypothetical protein